MRKSRIPYCKVLYVGVCRASENVVLYCMESYVISRTLHAWFKQGRSVSLRQGQTTPMHGVMRDVRWLSIYVQVLCVVCVV